MEKTKKTFKNQNNWFPMLLAFLLLVNWPFLLNIEALVPKFLFVYFFSAWLICIIALLLVTSRCSHTETDVDKKETI